MSLAPEIVFQIDQRCRLRARYAAEAAARMGAYGMVVTVTSPAIKDGLLRTVGALGEGVGTSREQRHQQVTPAARSSLEPRASGDLARWTHKHKDLDAHR